MKKMMMMWVMVLTTMIFVGCSKASKYEKVCREIATLQEKNGGPKVDEEKIKKEVEDFKKMPSEQQELMLKMGEGVLEMMKKESGGKK